MQPNPKYMIRKIFKAYACEAKMIAFNWEVLLNHGWKHVRLALRITFSHQKKLRLVFGILCESSSRRKCQMWFEALHVSLDDFLYFIFSWRLNH